MDDWEKFSEISLPEKEDFYILLIIEDITDADYEHAKRVCKDFQINNLGEHNGLYVPSNTLLMADVFENFQNICIEICKLDPTCFSYCTRISMASSLKKIKVKIDLLTDIDMLLVVEVV